MCCRWWPAESSRPPALRWRAPSRHMCASPRPQVVQGRGQVGILLASDCGRTHLKQVVDRQTNARSGQGSRKEETHRDVTPIPTCAPSPIVSLGALAASLLSCILLHYYADILIMQICF